MLMRYRLILVAPGAGVKVTFLVALLATFLSFTTFAASENNMKQRLQKQQKTYYRDGFEGDEDTSWNMFEEVVGGSNCYAAGYGEVIVDSKRASMEGSFGMNLKSNAKNGPFSNHVIAHKTINHKNLPRDSRFMSYTMNSFIPEESINFSQTGPEFSIQNTRLATAPDGHENILPYTSTSIAGIQYIASPYITNNKWNVWMQVAPGVAEWRPIDWNGTEVDVLKSSSSSSSSNKLSSGLSSQLPFLQANTWYEMTLTVDFQSNKYISLTISSFQLSKKKKKDKNKNKNKNKKLTFLYTINLKNVSIAYEDRGFAEAMVITLEGQNLWNNCGAAGNYSSNMYYDNLELSAVPN